MRRLGYIAYSEAFTATLGPKAWLFGRDMPKQNVNLWTGTDWSLALPRAVPPWPIELEAMAVHLYDATDKPGYAYTGAWFEFGVLLDGSTYMPIHAGYTDDAGRLRWTGKVHSHRAVLLVIGNNPVTAGKSAHCRFQAQYLEEVLS